MNNKSQLDVEHLEWAIDQRAKIQHTLLALYVYVRDTEPEESWVYTEAIVNSLIAASFSLWRAVFLAEQTRTDASVRQAQRDFLATVTSTNAVTSPTIAATAPGPLAFIWTRRPNECGRQ